LKCPYRDSCQDWTEGLTELLSERAFWRTKALGRIEEISKRDKQELSALNEFVTKIGTNSA
jgi:hypothetical protein